MGYRRDYFKSTFGRAFKEWDLRSTALALVLVVLTAGGYIGLRLDWWRADSLGILSGEIPAYVSLLMLVYLVGFGIPAHRWHEHNEQVHPIGKLDFAADTSDRDKTAILYLELHDAPTGHYEATGRKLNDETRPVWPITWGVESTPRCDVIYPNVPRLNIAKIDWNNSTIRFINLGKDNESTPPEYLLHEPHSFEGNRCDVSLVLGSQVFGHGYYEITVSAWWDDSDPEPLRTDVEYHFCTEPMD